LAQTEFPRGTIGIRKRDCFLSENLVGDQNQYILYPFLMDSHANIKGKERRFIEVINGQRRKL
jgi:hypothetical protein